MAESSRRSLTVAEIAMLITLVCTSVPTAIISIVVAMRTQETARGVDEIQDTVEHNTRTQQQTQSEVKAVHTIVNSRTDTLTNKNDQLTSEVLALSKAIAELREMQRQAYPNREGIQPKSDVEGLP